MSGLTIDEDLKKGNMKIVLIQPFPKRIMDRVVFCSQLDKKTLARIHGLLPNNIVNAMQSVFVGREDDTYISQ